MIMFTITRKSIEWGGKRLTLETGKIARQADGAVMVTYGEITLLCTVVSAKKAKPDIDFFPLTVNYQEKTFAAGKIPGGFFKREGRPTERETLTSRLIDRPIRPLFHDEFKNETQVVCTLLATDKESNPDIAALIGASAALTIAGVPFFGPVAGARVGYTAGDYVLNPTDAQLQESTLDLVVAGTQSSVLMVESEAQELSEEVMLGAVMFGHKQMQPVIDLIVDFAECCAKDAWAVNAYERAEELYAAVKLAGEDAFRAAYLLRDKQARQNALSQARDVIMQALEGSDHPSIKIVSAIKKLEQAIVRSDLIATKERIDGRGLADIRPIEVEVGILPRTHGSALFTRGETQALVVTTLGTSQDEQIIDALEGEYKEKFMLHYNFPPYSTGEASPMRSPGRREIGHGKLAWRAVRPLLPTSEEFPYTIRIVSEITESNGSSSMATVCGSSMAMMDAGVPLARPVAGIAMGLIKEQDAFVVLSDILGDEDHLGDMDFKVAGTARGVTALQMDIKIDGITEEIMKVALAQASTGRKHILGEMEKAITQSRDDVRENAPSITTMNIHKDKIREVIGSGGKVIREICEQTGAKIDIEDDGTIRIYAVTGTAAQAARDWIHNIVAEPEVGRIYDGKVVSIVDFGAFVNFVGPHEGLVHVSEITGERIADVRSVLAEGAMVKVKLVEKDQRGKFRLSMRRVNQETGEEIIIEEEEGEEGEARSARPERNDRSRRPRRDKRG
ncbi:MAG: polyribonucleotide nucleotidyltransferase [Alphaproteobacteria bacterium]|nr:MAG: polyribonucleotide nucleotidyltransferase [Alphaproteobacteria bacterium]